MKTIFALLFLLVASAASQQAVPTSSMVIESGNSYLAACSNPNKAPIACTLYVAGVVDGVGMSKKPYFCAPEGVTYGQDARILVKYIQDHPDQSQYSTRVLIVISHEQAFPCPVAVSAK